MIQPGDAPGYGPIFNAGLLHDGERFQLFARGIRDGYRRNTGSSGPRFLDYVSDVLLFSSADGHTYSYDGVLLASDGEEVHAIEDPRVQRVASNHVGGSRADHLVMTYTRLSHPDSNRPWQIGAHRMELGTNGLVVDPSSAVVLGPPDLHDKDAVVFNLADGRVALMHRIHPDIQVAVFDDLDHLWTADGHYWEDHVAQIERHTIIRPTPGSLGVGAGAPPLLCDAGLLLFFHERRADGVYTMNVALLDPGSGAVLSILAGSIMEPELEWERVGDVDNVVFVQGVHRVDDGQLYLTYGAADRCVGAALVDERSLLDAFVAQRA